MKTFVLFSCFALMVFAQPDLPETAVETTPPPEEIKAIYEQLNDYEKAVFQYSLMYNRIPKQISAFVPQMITMLKNKHLEDNLQEELLKAFDTRPEIYKFKDVEKARVDLENALTLIGPV